MIIPTEKINEAKALYDGEAIKEIFEHFGYEYDGKTKGILCPFHNDKNASFIWNPKANALHCFSKETRVITKSGILPISDIINKPVEIINGNGQWEQVTFRNCGKQEILKLTLTSNSKIKEIYATPEHEWILRNKKSKVQTKDLKPNDKLERMWYKYGNIIQPSIEGMRHGFLYGDGNKVKNRYYARICDKTKYEFCQKIFDVKEPLDCILKCLPNCLGTISYKALYNAKEVPAFDNSLEYLYGFLIGYFVADGNCSDGTIQIHSTKYNDIVKVKHIFTLLGIPSYPIGKTIRQKGQNMGAFTLSKDSPLYVLRVVKALVPNNFYQSNKNPSAKSIYQSYLGWKVVSVEKTHKYEYVYCCETSTHSFVLDGFILTGNCFGCNRNYDIIDLYLDQGLTFLEAVQKLFKNVGIEYTFDERGKQSKQAYKYPMREIGFDRSQVEHYMMQRQISSKTLDYADVQADKDGNVVFHYYDANDVLLNTKYRPSHKIATGETKCWFQKGADTTPILYNMNRIDPTKPLVITEGECFKGDTEVLTPKGWIRLDQYNNEKVVQINQDLTGEFVLPISYIKKDYDGDMYYLSKGRNYSLEVTAGHNIVYVDKKRNIIKKAAKDMPKSIGSGFLPTTTTIDGNGINLSKEQIALYIAISADCTIDIRKTTRHSRFAVKKERKYLRLKGLLDALNISYFDNSNASNGYYYIGFKTPEWVKSKMFPVEWLEQATLEQRRFILDEMVYWDGNRVPNRNQVEYSSKIYEQVVWMQTIAHTCGYMSTIMKRRNKYGEWYKVSILFNKNSVSFQHGFDSIQNYKGNVYCVTVPTGMILIRHQGHISICGNCDTLSIIEAGYPNVVSVPTGAQSTSWIGECWDWLEQFKKIIIWSDNDAPGIKMRQECVRRLGSWRTFYVEINEDDTRSDKKICKDANEILYFYGKEKVLEYINSPIETPIEGVLDLAEAEDFNIESAEGLYTGIKDLDDKIYKLVFGTVTLITGLPGSGKSVFANQIGIAEALNQGYNCFVYSGELPAPILRNWVETNLIGRENITMKNELVRVLNPTARQQLKEWYKGRVILYDDSLGVTSTSLLEKMEEAVRKLGCRVITIDNLMCIDLMCNETERLEAEKNFVKDLVLFAKKFNVLIFLLAHPRKALAGETSLNLQSVSGASAIGNLCHMAFAIHRYTNKEKEGERNQRGEYIKGCEPKTYDTYIEVIKNRLTGLMPKIEVYFDFPSYRFYRTPQEVWKRYKWNKDLTPISLVDPNNHDIVKENPLNG